MCGGQFVSLNEFSVIVPVWVIWSLAVNVVEAVVHSSLGSTSIM